MKETVRSVDRKEDLGSRANLLIMDTATRGETECRGPLAWSWKIVGTYVVAYIEDLDKHADHFRVFRCRERGYYDRKLLLHPSYMSDEYTCIYDAVENPKGREIRHSTAEEWLDYVAKATTG